MAARCGSSSSRASRATPRSPPQRLCAGKSGPTGTRRRLARQPPGVGEPGRLAGGPVHGDARRRPAPARPQHRLAPAPPAEDGMDGRRARPGPAGCRRRARRRPAPRGGPSRRCRGTSPVHTSAESWRRGQTPLAAAGLAQGVEQRRERRADGVGAGGLAPAEQGVGDARPSRGPHPARARVTGASTPARAGGRGRPRGGAAVPGPRSTIAAAARRRPAAPAATSSRSSGQVAAMAQNRSTARRRRCVAEARRRGCTHQTPASPNRTEEGGAVRRSGNTGGSPVKAPGSPMCGSATASQSAAGQAAASPVTAGGQEVGDAGGAVAEGATRRAGLTPVAVAVSLCGRCRRAPATSSRSSRRARPGVERATLDAGGLTPGDGEVLQGLQGQLQLVGEWSRWRWSGCGTWRPPRWFRSLRVGSVHLKAFSGTVFRSPESEHSKEFRRPGGARRRRTRRSSPAGRARRPARAGPRPAWPWPSGWPG